ncbi:MAG: DUF3617 domain-containing protein [Burkholderiales bacterium]
MRIVLTLAAALAAAPALAQPQVRPGMWEYTMKMDMGGKGQPMQMQHKACLTKEQIARNEHMVPRQGKDDTDCKVTSQKVEGSTVSFVMECTKPEPMRTEGRTTFKGDSFQSDLSFTGRNQKFKQQVTARRVGECGK